MPQVRYKDLVSALQGFADIAALESAQRNPRMAGLYESVEGDEARLAELESLFQLLDRDGNGRIALGELEAAVEALQPAVGSEDSQPTQSASLTELTSRLRQSSLGESSATAAEDGSVASDDTREVNVDLATFLRLMTTKAVADYSAPERELMPAFEALDLDGDGRISQAEMMKTIGSFCYALPDADGCDLDNLGALPLAFDAFADEEHLLDYERFVEMLSGRTAPLECEIGYDEAADARAVFGADL